MATRYSGELRIELQYEAASNDYPVSIYRGRTRLWRGRINPPQAWVRRGGKRKGLLLPESREAFNRIAESALDFAAEQMGVDIEQYGEFKRAPALVRFGLFRIRHTPYRHAYRSRRAILDKKSLVRIVQLAQQYRNYLIRTTRTGKPAVDTEVMEVLHDTLLERCGRTYEHYIRLASSNRQIVLFDLQKAIREARQGRDCSGMTSKHSSEPFGLVGPHEIDWTTGRSRNFPRHLIVFIPKGLKTEGDPRRRRGGLTRKRSSSRLRRATPREKKLLAVAMKRWHGLQLPNGIAAKRHLQPKRFDPDQLAIGIRVEQEHTRRPELAMEIAMAHLYERSDYYKLLEKMEKTPRAASNGRRRLTRKHSRNPSRFVKRAK